MFLHILNCLHNAHLNTACSSRQKVQAMSPSAAAAQERSPISFFLPHKQEVWPQVALCITPGGRSKSSPYCDSDDAGAVDHGDDVALCTYLTHNSLCFSLSCKIHEFLIGQNMPKIVSTDFSITLL